MTVTIPPQTHTPAERSAGRSVRLPLDFTNEWLVYGQETILPFYLLHQPVIIVSAFFVVQWDAGVTLKLPVVVLGSLLGTVGLVELIIRRTNVLGGLFGIKTKRREMPSTAPG